MRVDFEVREDVAGPETVSGPDGSAYGTRSAEREEAGRAFATASELAGERAADFGSRADRGRAFSAHDDEAARSGGRKAARRGGSRNESTAIEDGSADNDRPAGTRSAADSDGFFSARSISGTAAMAALRSARDGEPMDDVVADAAEAIDTGYRAVKVARATGSAAFSSSLADSAISSFYASRDGELVDDAFPTAAQGASKARKAAKRIGRWKASRPGSNSAASGRAQAKARELHRARAATNAGEVGHTATATASRREAIAWAVGRGRAGSAAGAASVALAPALPIFGGLFVIVVIAAIATSIGSFMGSQQQGGMGATEQQVAQFLLGKGLNPVQTAAIMGNMYAESGMDPAAIEDGWDAASTSNEEVIALGSSQGHGFGICQWSSGRNAALARFADSCGTHWSDLATQLNFFWDHDEWSGNWGYGAYTKAAFMRISDPGDLDRAVTIFCRGWERPGVERLEERQDAAQRYYLMLTATGEDYASATEAQRSIVDAARTTPTAGGGMCLKWVSNVFQAAGQPRVKGATASVAYRQWCTSSDRSQLKVGMIVAVDRSTTSTAGHIGIYIGDGLVMHNTGTAGTTGSVSTDTLDDWIKNHVPAGHEARWGWANAIDLSAQ